MPTCQSLPEGYREYYAIDLQKDKKTALLVNGLSLLLALVTGIVMHLCYPVWHYFEDLEPRKLLVRNAVFFLSLLAYVCLHELTHAAAMKHYGGAEVRFGFTGLYAYAGSEKDYFGKKPYTVIALAPVVVWGVIFLVVSLLVTGSWRWIVFFLQIMNVSGAAGDLYVALKVSRFPDDILVRDTGVGMTVYSRQEAADRPQGS